MSPTPTYIPSISRDTPTRFTAPAPRAPVMPTVEILEDSIVSRTDQLANQVLSESDKDQLIAELQGRVQHLTRENNRLTSENERLGNALIAQGVRIAELEARAEADRAAFLAAIADMNTRYSDLDKKYELTKGLAIASMVVGVAAVGIGAACVAVTAPAVGAAVCAACRSFVIAVKKLT